MTVVQRREDGGWEQRRGQDVERSGKIQILIPPPPCLPPQAKPLFRSTRSHPAVETSAQAAPQTYAEYAISEPAGGAGAPHPTGPEPQAGETPNQALKPGTKSNSIIVSPRQVRSGLEKWGSEVFSGRRGDGYGFLMGSDRTSQF